VNAIPDCKGVILCAYGSGNMPMSPASGMQEALREVVEKEIMVVVISQCESLFLLSCFLFFKVLFVFEANL